MMERPILFSAPMVRALLAGTKTQTRRVVQPRDLKWMDEHQGLREPCNAVRCPYGQPGDRMWVRETWAPGDMMVFNAEKDDPETVLYRADKAALHWDGEAMRMPMDTYAFAWDSVRWKPSIFMPRWASRVALEVTGVRAERLQDISVADAMAEGVVECNENLRGLEPCMEWRYAYEDLWRSINGASSWDANPWVWVVAFRRVTEPSNVAGNRPRSGPG